MVVVVVRAIQQLIYDVLNVKITMETSVCLKVPNRCIQHMVIRYYVGFIRFYIVSFLKLQLVYLKKILVQWKQTYLLYSDNAFLSNALTMRTHLYFLYF